MRFLNRDGSFNIDRSVRRDKKWGDLYHLTLSVSWSRLILLIALVYLSVNFVFGAAYFAAGPSALQGFRASEGPARFWECFFFSVQTLATIGYGQLSPVSTPANILVTFEALTGLMGIALATGIVFARFSRPTARVCFSEKMLMTHVDGKPCLMFRMANARLNHVVEAQVRVTLVWTETTTEGLRFREMYDLALERERSPLFAMSWTVIHPIDERSPLYRATQESLKKTDLEIFVTVIGTDETFSQTVHSRASYIHEDLEWGTHFVDIVSRTPEGKFHLDLALLSQTRRA